MKIRTFGDELFNVNVWKDGQTDMTMPTGAFRNFANVPKKNSQIKFITKNIFLYIQICRYLTSYPLVLFSGSSCLFLNTKVLGSSKTLENNY